MNDETEEPNVKYCGKDELYCHWYDCLSCEDGDVSEFANYCPNCGIKIIWGNHRKNE